MRVLVAPDKFKGTLTAPEVAARVAAGIGAEAPDVEVVQVPVADGGDGTLDAALAAGYARVEVPARGPTGEPVTTAFAALDGVAVVEMADVSGLAMLMPDRLDALRASSYGTGEVIRAALDHGCRTIVLGIGGSASTDGGAGMLQALGARLSDADGRDLGPGGAALGALDRLDLSGLHPALAETRVIVASDVDNPLLGPDGAAAVYGPQKGAGEADVATLDAALTRWADVVEAAVVGGPPALEECHIAATPSQECDIAAAPATTRALRDRPGAGAAGGVGFGAMAVLGAELRSGIGLVLELVGFARHLAGASLVITGEGSLDAQTLSGKAPAGVAAAAKEAGVPVVTVSGRVVLTPDQLAAAGIRRAYALADIEADPERCFAEAGPLLEELARTLANEWLKENR
ncbi:MAG: glycerate kinase [Pseudonocardia sp.]|nr:glycerate kinase [Pseudonocardia sp.]